MMERCCFSFSGLVMLGLLSVLSLMTVAVGCFVPPGGGHMSLSTTEPTAYVTTMGTTHSCYTANCSWYPRPRELSLFTATSLLLATMIHKAQWNYVFIIYDDQYEGEVPEMTQMLAGSGISYMLYRYSQLDPASGGLGLGALLPLGTDSWLQHFRFLLLCSPANTTLVLRQADHFQMKHKQRSALFMTSQWLILVDPDAFERLDVNNVTMMHVTLVSCHAGKSCCWQGGPSIDGCGLVRTLLWEGADKSMLCLGTVLDVLNGRHDVFPGRDWGFSRRLLSVSTLPWKGFVERTVTATGTEYSGLCIDLLKQLAFLMNFTFHLSEPADGIWGIQYDNGTWAGLIGQLASSEVDLVIAPLTVTFQREQAMDFTYPYFNDADTVIYKKPDPTKDKWRTYLQPLKWQVLVCIAVSLVITSLLLGFIESWTPFYAANRVPGLTGRHSSYFHAFRLIYGALFAQATDDDHLPRSHSGRLLASFWWLFSIVVAATYSGNLVAFFTVTKTKALFNTLHDLLNQDTYKIGFMGASAIHHTVKVSSSSLHRNMWSKVAEWTAEDPHYLTTNISVHRARLMEGSYAFVSDKATLERWTNADCTLELTKETFLPIEYGVGLPNDSAFTRIFSEKILQMHENGQLGKLREIWWPDNPTCESTSTTTVSSPSVTLLEVQSAFFLLLVGLGLGLLALTVEYVLTLPLWARLHKCLVQEKNS